MRRSSGVDMFEDGMSSTSSLGLSHGYTPIRNIGRGSFGMATLVRNKEGGVFVLKALDLGGVSSKQKEETVEEASVLATLKHPYIVRYHDGFIEAGSLAIITEFAEGGDLHRRIEQVKQQGQTFSEPQIARWLTQAALGLKYVHERRIIHRDLKSQNLFLNRADHILLGDFGICKVLPASCSDTTVTEERTIGTPLYFSPEVVNRCVYSFASDMWALGCVLHELATLRLPFEASNLPALAAKIMRGTMPQLPAPFSTELRQVCADLLAHDPERRLTCAELVKKPGLKAEMARMLHEEQRNVGGSAPATAQHSRAPSRLKLPQHNEREHSFPVTPSGSFPTTPSGTLQRVGSAALMQRPPLSKFPPVEGGSCSRASSRPSSRPTSVGSGQLSRTSSFSSLAASQAGSRPGSRSVSRAGSRPGSRDVSARGVGREASAPLGPPFQSTLLPARCNDPGYASFGRPPISAGYA